MQRATVHPALFLGSALILCALILWLRPAPPPPAARERVVEAVRVEVQVLERYVGRYRLANGTGVVMVRDGFRLFAELDTGARLELVPTSDRDFVVPGTAATVRFPAGDEPAAELNVVVGRNALRARRIE